jgi:hypothetical protein
LDFHDAAVRLESTTNTLTEALEYDAHCPASACSPSIDSLNHLVGIISLILDDELFDFDEAHEQLDTAVQGIESAFGDDVDTIAHLTPLTTSDQHEISTSNLGPTARHTTLAASASTPLPSTPLYHRYSVDPGTISDHPTPVSLTTHHEHDRTYATPSLSPSSRIDNSYAYGCNTSLASVDEHHTNLQPHEFVSDDYNNKHEKQTLTTIYTQNAQGLWRRPRDADGAILVDQPPDLSKLEYLIDYMCQNDVGAWMIQETWEEGDEFDIDINGYHIFRHNANRGESGRAHLSRGVAIILSPLFYDVWKAAGSPPPITTDHNDDFVGRFMQMNLKFDSFDSRGRRIKGKVLSKALILAYFPCDDQRHDQFCALLDSVLSSIGPSTQIILGGDINARIGIWHCNEHRDTLGPHGIPRSNARGDNLLQVLIANRLRVENTFFHHHHDKYVTYTSLPTHHHPRGVPSMHDIFACSISLHKRIQDCVTSLMGVVSNHHAVRLTISLTSIKFKPKTVTRGTTNWSQILSDNHSRIVYNEHLLQLTDNTMDYDTYQEAILQPGALTATHHKKQCTGWFQMSRTTLAPLLTERNQILHALNALVTSLLPFMPPCTVTSNDSSSCYACSITCQSNLVC